MHPDFFVIKQFAFIISFVMLMSTSTLIKLKTYKIDALLSSEGIISVSVLVVFSSEESASELIAPRPTLLHTHTPAHHASQTPTRVFWGCSTPLLDEPSLNL